MGFERGERMTALKDSVTRSELTVPEDSPGPKDRSDAAAKSMMGRSVARRIIIGLVVVGVLLAVLAVSVALKIRERAMAEAERSLRTRALMLADHAQNALNSIDLVEQLVIDRIEVSGPRTPEELRQLVDNKANFEDLRGRVKVLAPLQALNIHDANGDQVVSTREWPTRQGNVADRPYFKTLSADPSITRVITGPRTTTVDHAWVIQIERPIHGPNGVFIGVLGGAVDLEYFRKFYTDSLAGPGSSVALFSEDGTFLTRAPQILGGLGRRFEEAKNEHALLPVGASDLLVQRGGLFDGVERLIVVRRVPSYPLAVHVSIEIRAALAIWRERVLALSVAVTGLEIALGWVGWLVWKQDKAAKALVHAMASQAEAEKKRLELADDLESLISTMPGLALRLQVNERGDLHPTFVSPSVLEFTGYTEEQVLDRTWPETHIGADDLRRLRMAEVDALKHGQSSVQISIQHHDGRTRRLSGKLRARKVDGWRDEVIIIWTDVTAEFEISAQLAHASKMATLGELSTGIAHEFSQPLAAISMAAENGLRMIKRRPDQVDGLIAKFEMIVSLAQRSADVIDHMRSFARTGVIPSGPVDLATVLREAAPLLKSKLNKANARLRIDLSDGLPAIWAKPVLLEQVLLNVIGNACDAYAYSPIEEAAVAAERIIRVSARSEHEQVVIHVQDNAGGIAPQVLKHIFEPFFTTKKAGEGTGLGLSISRTLIAEMGGSIVAENVDGGARFVIVLPEAAASHTQPEILV